MARFRIAIIGAGPAGCTLARLLLHKNVDVEIVVFEGEERLDARTQGGTLDLHTETGIAAMKQCGLYDQFEEKARFDGEGESFTNMYVRYNMIDNFQQRSESRTSISRPFSILLVRKI